MKIVLASNNAGKLAELYTQRVSVWPGSGLSNWPG